MTLSFTLTRKDYMLFQVQAVKLVRRRLPRGWGFLLQMGVWAFVGLAVSVFMRIYEDAFEFQRELAIMGCLILVAAAAYVAGQWISARTVQKHLVLDGGYLLAPQTITLDDSGMVIDVNQGLTSTRLSWTAFIGRSEDQTNLYLHLEPAYAVIIPKSSATGDAGALIRERVVEV